LYAPVPALLLRLPLYARARPGHSSVLSAPRFSNILDQKVQCVPATTEITTYSSSTYSDFHLSLQAPGDCGPGGVELSLLTMSVSAH
jgi:hypothetical protein